MIELGDLCDPVFENKQVVTRLKSLGKPGVPCYFTVGNHNSDRYPIDVVLDFYGMENSYYSFVFGNVKFIVLDANYIHTPNGSEPYYKRNYSVSKDDYPYIPQEEMDWLQTELANNEFYYVIFSHHSLCNDFVRRGVSNRGDIRAMLEQRNKDEKRVLFCMNGHDHGDDSTNINGIDYYTLNSMAYIWHGTKETYNYSKEIHQKYPHLKDLILYEEPLHILVTIDEGMNVQIDGFEGHYQNITPQEIGIGNTWNGISIAPRTSSRFISTRSQI